MLTRIIRLIRSRIPRSLGGTRLLGLPGRANEHRLHRSDPYKSTVSILLPKLRSLPDASVTYDRRRFIECYCEMYNSEAKEAERAFDAMVSFVDHLTTGVDPPGAIRIDGTNYRLTKTGDAITLAAQ